MEERLQKFLAECGIASRRKCEQLIKDGCISVNNEIIKDVGIKINTEKDIVRYKGKVVKTVEDRIYIMLNKPTGYVTTTREQFNRKKVTDLLKGINHRVFPVGRLDYNTSGLLLLTNDGDLTFKLTHPAHEVNKTYIAEVKGIPGVDDIEKLRNGIKIDEYMTAPAKVNIMKVFDDYSVIKTTIHEGRNRQVRKMFDAIGHEVLKLTRISIGTLSLGNLKTGEWRYLTSQEINYLKSL